METGLDIQMVHLKHNEVHCVNANEQKYGIVRAQPLVQLGRKLGLQSAAPSRALNSVHGEKSEKSLKKLGVMTQVFGEFKSRMSERQPENR